MRLFPQFMLLLATLSCGCTVWQKGAIAPIVKVEGVHRGAEALAFDPNSELLASGGWDGKVALWQTDQTEPIRIWQAHKGWIHGLAFFENLIVTGGFDGNLRSWRPNGTQVRGADARSSITRLIAHNDKVVTGHDDGFVRIWDRDSLVLQHEHRPHQDWVTALAANAATGQIASGAQDGNVYLLAAGDKPQRLMRPPRTIFSLSFGLDGQTLFAGGWFDLYRWDLAAQSAAQVAPEAISTPHWGNIISIQYLPSRDGIATISRTNDSSVLFLDPNSGQITQHFERQSICGGALSVSPDEQLMATTGDDGIVRIWDFHSAGIAANTAPRGIPTSFP